MVSSYTLAWSQDSGQYLTLEVVMESLLQKRSYSHSTKGRVRTFIPVCSCHPSHIVRYALQLGTGEYRMVVGRDIYRAYVRGGKCRVRIGKRIYV